MKRWHAGLGDGMERGGLRGVGWVAGGDMVGWKGGKKVDKWR